tara:strand:+ start:776 stop:1045 length:270 start_codon:yes stop_codon:yes gene_type:complete
VKYNLTEEGIRMSELVKELSKDLLVEDIPQVSRQGGLYPWRSFVETYGVEPLVWLSKYCEARNGTGMVYVPAIDRLTLPARRRGYKKEL